MKFIIFSGSTCCAPFKANRKHQIQAVSEVSGSNFYFELVQSLSINQQISMAKKRTTAEEKRQLLLALFKETEDVYQLKELEKVASKEKGLAMNVVKDVLQQLVDDGLVESGKVGTQNYYWLFKSKGVQEKQQELDELTDKLAEREKRLQELEDKLSKVNPDDFEDSEENAKLLEEARAKYKVIEEKLKESGQSGEVSKLVDELNAWTDNIFMVKAYVKNQLNMDTNQLDKEYSIPKDLDYM